MNKQQKLKEETSVMSKEKNYYLHESSYVDDNVKIKSGTKIWHFSHIQNGAMIGKKL